MRPSSWISARGYLRRLQPTQMVAMSFTAVIIAGTTLLSLPQAVTSDNRMPLIDAFFTAVSATCVTGLIVVDTGTHFTLFGQLVILACIQIGGLGLMTFTTVFVVLMGSRIAIRDRIAVQESFHHTPTGNLAVLVRYVVIATLVVELVGAALLTAVWSFQARFSSFGETVYYAVFHAISSFCNAGFSLHSDSLVGYRDDPWTLSILSFLIIIGGIGFLVALDIKEYLQQVLFGWHWRSEVRERITQVRPRPRISLHTKVVLITTAALLLIGTVSYYFLERRGLFEDMPAGVQWLNAWFCSVTARTAGFNTIDYGGMSGAALLCTIVLMFIGASPGSTGGGIKTSTFGLLVAYSVSRWFGFYRLNVFGRTVPALSVDRAAAIVVAALVLLIIGSSVLMATETYYMTSRESQGSFVSIVFESVSAFATVGLSMGETVKLGTPGKMMVAVLMFLGRVGPLTLALAISKRRRRVQLQYAEENIMVG